MKLLLLLLLPFMMTAQTFTPDEIDAIYERVKLGEYCAEDLKTAEKVAFDLYTELKKRNDEIIADAEKIQGLNDVIDKLEEDRNRLIADYERAVMKPRRKYVTIGPTAILGPDLKVRAGVGVTYNLFSF